MFSPISVLGAVLVLFGLWLAFRLYQRTRGLVRLSATVLRVDMEVTESLDHKPVTVYVPVYEFVVDGTRRTEKSAVKLESCKLQAGDQTWLRYNEETGQISPEQELRIARSICIGVILAGAAIIFLVWLELQGRL